MPRKRKDPDMPKRPLSSYMFYSRDRRPKLQEEKPNLQFGDYSKLIAEEWKTLDAESKQPYLDMSKKDKERYEEALKEYKEKKKNEPPPPMQPDFSSHKNFTTQDHIDHHQQQQQRNFMLQRQQQEMMMRQQQMRQAPPHVLQQMQQQAQAQGGRPWGQYMFAPQQGQGFDQGGAPNPRLAQQMQAQAGYAAYYNQYPPGYPGMPQPHHFQQQQHAQGQGQQYDPNHSGDNSDENHNIATNYPRQAQMPRGMPDPRAQQQAMARPSGPASGSGQMYPPGFPQNPYQFYGNPNFQQQMQQQFQDRIPPQMMYQQQMRAQMSKEMKNDNKPRQGPPQPNPFAQRQGLDLLQAQRNLELGAQRGGLDADGSNDFSGIDNFGGQGGDGNDGAHGWDNWPDVEEGVYGNVFVYDGPRKGNYGYYKETSPDDSGNAIVQLKSTGESIAVDLNDLKRVPEGVLGNS